ncbi:MAG: 4Fe-4S dicluster domain-containing protein [Deltaproteobacteria bacterium]|nr:4Fe-4S dicluster domain-containing protein [Deltaproteobacteria bacterium]
MAFISFIEGPLLWFSFLFFAAGIVTRFIFFSFTIIKSSKPKNPGWRSTIISFVRLFIPFHMAVIKRPVYAALRYLFHICLFVVPIWLAGHITLWEESKFEWTWGAISDEWADWMTLLFLFIAAYLFIRRIILSGIGTESKKEDLLLIIATALPFLTGYLYAHGTLDSIAFFDDNMGIIHILSGELMLIMVAFLFCRTRLNREVCTGCAACELSCPTGTIESSDEGRNRIFSYLLYQCISCGACVNTCPETAVELRHEIDLSRLFRPTSREIIQSVELKECEQCNGLYAPGPLMRKIEGVGLKITDDYIQFCPDCRRSNYLERIRVATR